VKELVLSMSVEKVLPFITIKEKDGKKISYGQGQMIILSLTGGNLMTMGIKESATSEEQEIWENIKELQDDAEEQLKSDIEISTIRTNSTDEIAKKCECSGQIDHPAIQPYQVNYSAQYTEDDKVIVEIY